jgi:hypothetical protein
LEAGFLSKSDIEVIKDMIEVLKAKCLEYNALLLNQLNKVLGNDYFTTQTMSSDNEFESIQQAVAHGLSIVDLKECLMTLREHYGLTDSEIGIIKSDIDPNIGNNKGSSKDGNGSDSKIVRINLYSLKDKSKLDTSVCNDDKITIKLPLPDDTPIDAVRYQIIKNQSNIDIYNPNDGVFTSRCYTHEMNGYDTTINIRRNELFANKTIKCNHGCTYNGLDNKNYTQCDCDSLDDEGYSSVAVDYVLNSFSYLNLDIVKCAGRAFDVRLRINI